MLLQFKEPVTEDYRDHITGKGVEFISYIPENTWITKISGNRGEIISEGKVRSIIPYKPGFRVDPWLKKEFNENSKSLQVQIKFFESAETPEKVIGKYGELNGKYATNTWKLETTYRNISELSTEKHVQFIAPEQPEYETKNDDSRELIGVNPLQKSPYNLEGQDLTAGIWDGGEVGKHDDLNYSGKLFLGETSSVNDHATHVAGTMLGAGKRTNDYRGMAPNSSVVSYDFYYDTITELYNEMDESITNYESILSQNSWGWVVDSDNEYLMGNYAGAAYNYDAIVSKETSDVADSIPVIFSAGNERGDSTDSIDPSYNSTTGPGGTAKNTITVGAVGDEGEMTSYSSWGPTDDGRIKPTVVANGGCGDNSAILSTTPGNNYGLKCGTSMAAPAVSGAAILLNQEFNNTYGRLPEPATTKAALIHTAEDLGREGPDYKFGWGLVNATRAVDYVQESEDENLVRRGIIADTGDSESYSVNVPEGESVKFTLVWSDYPGTSGSGKALINDLDLIVENSDGQRKYPWTLDWASRKDPAKQNQEDHTNPLEQVYIENPEGGEYSISVEGYDVPEGSQDYTLLMTSKDPEMTSPNLTVESPLNDTYSEVPDFNLSSNQSLDDAKYSIDGNQNFSMTKKNETYFHNTSAVVDDGRYEAVFWGNNSFGNLSSENVFFTLDRQVPNLDIKKPSNYSVVSGELNINATYSDSVSVVKGVNFSLKNSSGVLDSFPGNKSLDSSNYADGSYNIFFTVIDSAGNTEEKFINLEIDNSAPDVNIVSPQENSVVSTPFSASAAVSDATDVVRKDYEISNESGIQVSGNFNDTVDSQLSTGNYNISFEAEDEAGNFKNKTVEFGITEPVNLTVESPENLTYSEIPDFNLSSNVSMSDAKYSIDDIGNYTLVEKNEKYFYNTSVDLENGSHNAVFWANDSAGYWFSKEASFTVDTEKPSLTAKKPLHGENISGAFELNATWEDSVTEVESHSYTISNASYSEDGILNGSKDSRELSDGDYTVFYNVTDSAGNEEKISRDITVDNTPPELDITDPENNSKVSGVFDANASVSDATTGVDELNISLENASGVLDSSRGNTSFNSSDYSDGNYSIIFRVNDSAGNIREKTIEQEFDNTAPELSIVHPADDSSVKTPFDVDADWTDPSGISRAEFKVRNESGLQASGNLNGSIGSSDLSKGVYNISYLVEDSLGNLANKMINTSVSISPDIRVEYPENITYVEHPDFNISSDKKLSEAKVNLGDRNISLKSKNDTYFYNNSIELSSGRYEAVFYGTDTEGVTGTDSVGFTVDREPPEIKTLTPEDGFNTSSGFEINVSVSDALSDIDQKSFQVFNSSGAQSSRKDLNGTVNASDLADSEYNITINVSDSSGNYNTTNISFNLDTSRPSLNIFDPSNSVVSGSFDINFTSEDSGTGVRNASYILKNSSGDKLESGESNTSIDSSELIDSDYNLIFNASDFARNIRTSEVDLEVDNTPPEISLVSPLGENLSGNVDVEASVNDSNFDTSVYRWMQDGENKSSWNSVNSSDFDTRDLEDGEYSLAVKANDTLGNTERIEKGFTVDNTEPELNLTKYNYQELENDWVKSGFKVEVTCSDDTTGVKEIEYSVDGKDSITGNSSVNVTVNGSGTTPVDFSCRDFTGNEADNADLYSLDSGEPGIHVTTPENNSNDVSRSFELEIDLQSGEEDESGVNANNSFLEISDGSIENVNWSNSTVTADVSGLDYSESFTLTGNITDYAGQANKINLQYTTEDDPDGGGGGGGGSSGSSGGGGGSGGAPPTTTNTQQEEDKEATVSKTDRSVHVKNLDVNDESGEISLSDANTPVGSLEVSGTGSLDFKIERVENDEEDAPENTVSYSSVEMTVNRSGDISTNVTFMVSRSWMDENEVRAEKTSLYRKHNGNWQKLKTDMIDAGDSGFLYRAEVPDFSRFTIATERESCVQKNYTVIKDGECQQVSSCGEPEGQVVNGPCQEETTPKIEDKGNNKSNNSFKLPDPPEIDVGSYKTYFAGFIVLLLISVISYSSYRWYEKKQMQENLEDIKDIAPSDLELNAKIREAENAVAQGKYDKASKKIEKIKEIISK